MIVLWSHSRTLGIAYKILKFTRQYNHVLGPSPNNLNYLVHFGIFDEENKWIQYRI